VRMDRPIYHHRERMKNGVKEENSWARSWWRSRDGHFAIQST
jgi:hypothetical protein